MKITSTAFAHNQLLPSKYTCDGLNINPPLLFTDIPPQTKSLVLIVDDPDAPAHDWVHWTIWNIPAETQMINENSVPHGVQGTTDFGTVGWGGPCPPNGTHRYFFKLYALSDNLDLPNSARKSEIEKAMAEKILAIAEVVGLYHR